MKNGENKKDVSIKRLFLSATVCLSAAMISGALMLYHYFAPRKTETKVIVVPDLVGVCEDSMSVPQGIVVERDYIYSDDAEAGSVISQSPAPKSRRKRARDEAVRVKVTVSLGKKRGVVPDVVGLSYVSAAIRLREIGADVVAISVYDTDAKAGTVISSEPPRDAEISEGDRVVIYVARGRVNASVKVPDLVGMEGSQAITLILSRGLTLGNIEYIIADEALVGRVITQSPSPDVYVRGGTLIDITLGFDPSTERREERLDLD